MKRLPTTLVLGASLLLGASACTHSTTTARHARSAEAQQAAGAVYAAALEEAFVRYETDIERAARITFRSEAELQAVIATLSESRFDWHLRRTLAHVGLTVDALGAYAMAHPAFFHAQQQRHWGRLARAQARLHRLKVYPLDTDTIAFADPSAPE